MISENNQHNPTRVIELITEECLSEHNNDSRLNKYSATTSSKVLWSKNDVDSS